MTHKIKLSPSHQFQRQKMRNEFFNICDQAQAPESACISLYVRVPYYGGPEGGGWWGEDVNLVAFQKCHTLEEAEAKKQAVEQLVTARNKEEHKAYGDYCLHTMEWLENRGLDADYLPEPDGQIEYFVAVEKQPGSQTSIGTRSYE